MPCKNVVRHDAGDEYYHVYARGIDRRDIYRSPRDKEYFLYLISRHLSARPITNTQGYNYPHYHGRAELLCYCLMDNHFHLLIYQASQGTVSRLMQSILAAYTVYFNRTYDRKGPLFEGRYRSSRIDRDAYLLHVSRYIHLNPRSWKNYPYSSLHHIRKATEPDWLQTEKLLVQHPSREAYQTFVADYRSHKLLLSEIRHQLADL